MTIRPGYFGILPEIRLLFRINVFPDFVPVFGRVRKIAKATISSVMFVCPFVRLSIWNDSATIESLYIKFDI